MRAELNIIRRDWWEYHRSILGFTAGMFVPLFLASRQPEFSRGLTLGLLMTSGYGYAQFCFFAERQRETLELLLALPIRPMNIILAKYASMYSMVLFTVNLPGIFLADSKALFVSNAVALFLATVYMTPSVMTDRPWAPLAPLWMVVISTLPFKQWLTKFWPDGFRIFASVIAHPVLLGSVLLAWCPVIALFAAGWFENTLTAN